MKGFDQVIVRCEFGDRDYFLVAFFTGNHHENRAQRHHSVVAQLLEQLLTIALIFQMVVAKNDVDIARLDRAQHIGCTPRVGYRGGPERTYHFSQVGPIVRMAISHHDATTLEWSDAVGVSHTQTFLALGFSRAVVCPCS